MTVEQFLYRQAELLDGKHWQDVDRPVRRRRRLLDAGGARADRLGRLAVDLHARTSDDGDPRRAASSHPNAWSQAPAWGTNHLVGHVAIETADAEAAIVVRSRFHMMELRRDAIRHFGGRYRHTLHADDAGHSHPAAARGHVQRAGARIDYVLQIWV